MFGAIFNEGKVQKTLPALVYILVVVFVGIMPLFNNINVWDSALSFKEALQKLLRSPSALSRARSSLAYLVDMSRDSLRGFAHLGLLATLLQSFLNVYSGNITTAKILLSKNAPEYLPESFTPYLLPTTGGYYLDIVNWSDREVNAHPYPEKRIYKALLRKICSHAHGETMGLGIYEKSRWFDKNKRGYEYYYCEHGVVK